nr:PH domain-containing protein [Gracilibacillus halotolerans]
MWFGTGYKIEDGLIKIKSGPFKSTVRIKEIEKLSATRNPLSAPALSIDRIEILHGMYNIAIVSPNNKTEFIRILVNENSNIHVDENLINHVRDKR